MPPVFHHHPDGHVILRGKGRSYRATLAEFLTDCQALGLPAYPGLPDGWSERVYDGERDLLCRPDHRDDNPAPPGVLTAYLAAFDRLVAADIARDEGVQAARERQVAEMREAAADHNKRKKAASDAEMVTALERQAKATKDTENAIAARARKEPPAKGKPRR